LKNHCEVMGERIVRNDEVVGSIPTSSTKFSITYSRTVVPFCPKLVQNNSADGCRSLPLCTTPYQKGIEVERS
jgi:hypothetical protein